MEDTTQLIEDVLAHIAGQCRQLAVWLVEQREADLRTLEAGVLEHGHTLLRGLLGAVLATAPAANLPPSGHLSDLPGAHPAAGAP